MRYLFEDFVLDIERRELLRKGAVIPIEPKVFDLLAYIIQNRERVISRDDLLRSVWDGRIVSEAAQTTCINGARRALRDSGEEQRLIKTLPRKGIRFVGSARVEQGPPDAVPNAAPSSKPALVIPDKPSIAVVPFANISGDPEQEYFADGMTDDIITELSRFSDLFVIARNSSFQYKGKAIDVRQVGRELGVRYVLEGGIRRGGNRMRINAQLVDAVTGAHWWAERYDRQVDDLFVIQDQVVRAIAPVLVAHVNKAEVERTLLKPPSTWQAHDFYLRGSETLRAYLSSYQGVELHVARKFLEQSLAADPNYARTNVDLSYTYFTAWLNPVDGDFLKPEALDRAYALARKAVQLDPNLPVCRAQLGMVLTFRRRHNEAIAEFERAHGLNPNFNDWRFANSLAYAGDAARALEVADTIVRLDPFYVPLAGGFRGLAYYMLKRYDTAIASLSEGRWPVAATSTGPPMARRRLCPGRAA